MLRYLCLARVNRSLVKLPRWPAAELSLVLGSIIADRLPTRQAHQWHKVLSPWQEYGGEAINVNLVAGAEVTKKTTAIPEATWPVETAFFVYPGKMTYGQGELIAWELKLLGEGAEHGFFLEVILPALEEASRTTNSQWNYQYSLWGRFDIDSIYVARGRQWMPVVQAGKLDARYRPSPTQWADGLDFDPNAAGDIKNLTWLTPFDLTAALPTESEPTSSKTGRQTITFSETPTLTKILEALLARLTVFLPGKHHTPADIWPALSAEEQTSLRQAMEEAQSIPAYLKSLKPAPAYAPGRWLAEQTFPTIPTSVIPYLELASMLHVGRQTHLGCGVFTLD